MRKKVLIVEDNDLNLRLFNDVLAAEGYETLTATGEEDVPAMARRARPDLILMDMRHRGGDGVETTRRLKRDGETSGIPVIAVTGRARAGDEARFRAEGCADYLVKPVSLVHFLGSVRRHLGEVAP